jgi:hypothetical protein
MRRQVVGSVLEKFFTSLKSTIEHSVRRGLPSAKILPSTLGDKPALRGALSLVLVSKFAAAFAA